MRILLDHNVPRPLAALLTGHDVKTAGPISWSTLANGELLKAVQDAGFDALITGDKNLSYQQNLRSRTLALIVLPLTRWSDLRAYVPEILQTLENLKPSAFVIIPEQGKSGKRSALKIAKEQELESSDHTNDDGYWAGDNGQASGILPIAKDTGRICLAWRNEECHQGDCWGGIGGAVQKGKSPEESAKAEMAEETGYDGAIETHPAFYEWVRPESRSCDCPAWSRDRTCRPIGSTLGGQAER